MKTSSREHIVAVTKSDQRLAIVAQRLKAEVITQRKGPDGGNNRDRNQRQRTRPSPSLRLAVSHIWSLLSPFGVSGCNSVHFLDDACCDGWR